MYDSFFFAYDKETLTNKIVYTYIYICIIFLMIKSKNILYNPNTYIIICLFVSPFIFAWKNWNKSKKYIFKLKDTIIHFEFLPINYVVVRLADSLTVFYVKSKFF